MLDTKPSLFPVQDIDANPFVICVPAGDELQYHITVSYPEASHEDVAVIVFFKNLFIINDSAEVLIGTVDNQNDFVTRNSPVTVNVFNSIDLQSSLNRDDYSWPNGDYIFRDAAVNIGHGDGTASYDVWFRNQCD